MKYSLTSEHKKILKTWSKQWIDNALSTKAMDDEEKKIVINNVNKLYCAANLAPPKNIVFVSSPFVLRFAGGLAKAIWKQRKTTHQATDKAIDEATYQATHQATYEVTDEATNGTTLQATLYATIQATHQATDQATLQATDQATHQAIHEATLYTTLQATDKATLHATYEATDEAIHEATHQAIHEATLYTTLQATDQATHQATIQATYNETIRAIDEATREATREATDEATHQATFYTTLQATDKATIHATREVIYQATDNETITAIDQAIDQATREAIHQATRQATYNKTIQATNQATDNETIRATYKATDNETIIATYEATHHATYEAIHEATHQAIHEATDQALEREKRFYITDNCLKELDDLYGLNKEGIKESSLLYNNYLQGGNQWSNWVSYVTFFRYVVRLDLSHNIDYTNWDIWEQLCLHSGPRIVAPEFAMISDRPMTLLVDEQNRPHCTTGPFCEWRDGSKIFAVHGVFVPAWIVLHKEQITKEKIDAEENIEVRRIMLEFFGQERYLKESNYEVLDEDLDQFNQRRRVLRVQNGNDEPIVKVEVTNSSPELDKTFKTYLLSVDPEGRPLFPNKTEKEIEYITANEKDLSREEMIKKKYLGKKQKLTCHNLVASTFGLYGHEYGLNGQIRQGDVFLNFKDGSNNLPFRES